MYNSTSSADQPKPLVKRAIEKADNPDIMF